ncbi:MAG: Flp pilus assembly protein CpaB [Gammaproteobacteria bacterium]|nr:Flp pilus assembly protein CpaB [Gammaproteobacteria bacterium]
MKKRTTMLLFLSLVMGAGAAWVANTWIGARLVPEANAEVDSSLVVAAAIAIPFGTKLEQNHIKSISMPKEAVPGGAFLDTEAALGKITKQALFPGEILIKEKLADHDGGSTLAAVIQPKMRAITLRVNDVVGVAGFLLPGNRVDVLSSKRIGNNKAVTETVLRDIKVLAVDQTAATDKNEPVIVRAVTLEMTPDQSEELISAQQSGHIQLTLRNPNDDSVPEPVEPVVEPAPKKVARAPRRVSSPPVSRVTIIKGTAVHTEKQKK